MTLFKQIEYSCLIYLLILTNLRFSCSFKLKIIIQFYYVNAQKPLETLWTYKSHFLFRSEFQKTSQALSQKHCWSICNLSLYHFLSFILSLSFSLFLSFSPFFLYFYLSLFSSYISIFLSFFLSVFIWIFCSIVRMKELKSEKGQYTQNEYFFQIQKKI